MDLELARFPVTDVDFGPATRLSGRTLLVDAAALRRDVLQDDRLVDCQVALMRPGEAVRVIHVVDVIEPAVKVTTGDYFAGLTGSMSSLGLGRTNVLKGATVVVSCALPSAQEGIIDMTGTAATLAKFGKTCNVVVLPQLRPGLPNEEAARAAMECGLRAAVHLARATLDAQPETVESMHWAEPEPGLPRVAYLYYLYSHGYGRERLLYGKTTRDILPTLVHPNEVLDGAVVQCGFTMPSKSVTFNHQNCGIIRALHRRHNIDFALTGVVIINHNLTFADKRRSAEAAARLARHTLRCAGVIVSKDGGGQADVDLAECTEACEGVGLKTVLVVKEEGGELGAAYPLVVVSPRADAIVTTGNGTEHIHVYNRVERLIGGDTLYEGQNAAGADLELPYNYMVGAVDFEGDILVRTRVL